MEALPKYYFPEVVGLFHSSRRLNLEPLALPLSALDPKRAFDCRYWTMLANVLMLIWVYEVET
jgi:hypothetical protein